MLKSCHPETKVEVTADWNDLVCINNKESQCPAKLNNFGKQKVHLVCNVFDQKVYTFLKQEGFSGTSIFVGQLSRVWKILYIRSPEA